jgi:chitodextrinase
MNRLHLHQLIFLVLLFCTPSSVSAQTCAAPWSSTTVYTGGMQASVNGVNYTANFWTQNQNPTTNNGGPGSGQPWTSNGACGGSGGGGGGGGTGGCAPAWISTQVYTAGNTASVNGVNYIANFWTQGQNPSTNNGGPGSGAPWSSTGTCLTCTALPATPTSLRSSGTTACTTTLDWNAVTPPTACSITSYTVFKNGASIGSTNTTTFRVTGLNASTTYTFAVAANDSAGASGRASINVTTQAGTCTVSANKLFAPYIDMGLSRSQQILTIQQQSGIGTFTLGFIVGNGCTPMWGGLGIGIDGNLPNGTSMTTTIQGVRNQGGDVIVSFGGSSGAELAQTCTSVSQLQAAYQSVVTRYNLSFIDLDIEGSGSLATDVVDRRNQALAGLAAANPNLKISLTLPVLPTGLIPTGLNVITSAVRNSVRVDVVNVMAMDYGSANDNGGNMLLSAEQAAQNTRDQIASAGLNAGIGVTPMIGVNDVSSEVFRLTDATGLVNFANSNSFIRRLAMWSVNRDNGGCAGGGFASATCSGLTQNEWDFAHAFANFR